MTLSCVRELGELVSPKVKPSSTVRSEGTGVQGGWGHMGGALGGSGGAAAPLLSLLPHPRERRQGVAGANRKARARGPGRGVGLASGGRLALLPVRLAALPECPGKPVPGHRAGRFGGFGALEMGDGSAVPKAGSERLPVPSEPGLRAQQVSTFRKPQMEPGLARQCVT